MRETGCQTIQSDLEQLRLELLDTQWPFTYTDHDRQIVRAIVVDDAGRYCFVRATRDDDFGKATLIETSGGGVEPGEKLETAIQRELREELGAEVEILCSIGLVSDYYNLIHRHNLNHYYLCRALSFGEKHLTPDEVDSFHLSTLRLSYEEAVREYENCACTPLGRLLAARELPILDRARQLLRPRGAMDCISVENMRDSDRLTIELLTAGRTLMYRAALGVYRAASWEGKTAIAVGGGNNGGDGYALACILTKHGHSCRIVKLSDRLTPDSAYYAEQAAMLGVPSEEYREGVFQACDRVVDCLLGTGFQGSLREPWLTAVREINACGAQVISVDINSGMNGDTGSAETAVRSDLTVAVGFLKRGLVAANAGAWIQNLVVADIGIVLATQEDLIFTTEASERSNTMPCRNWLRTKPIDVRTASEEKENRL